ncbi:ABC transporter ATP-binding protein [Leptolyngbya sp. FACHB-261]|uniref:ABC transporter ATP-binding protein n=1 Tax=Leptolyngbya sp. FACHB-261 TaxID=2692806 RepID=UPI001682A502|nr:ABC transporter ATP-binding protein [Leptolyngbya sp. FACHB-261]MBD2103024.1 ABC transporter ATP-binding protein [Leptolyngbya sp. FACHB-261]
MSQTTVQAALQVQTEFQHDVELRKVSKVFNGETAVRGIDLDIRKGEFFSILGPSGCGKTTTLRLIAGFEEPSAGEVYIRNQLMTRVPAYRRPVNTVFQNYALFGHMSVWDNVAFGLRIKGLGRAEIQDRVRDALKLVKMESFASRSPAQLSGGQQQRVALARALVNRPTVVLLDEPLGALDLKLRKQMQVELSNLQDDLGITFVMVTHDQEEALSISCRIAVMNAGRIEQIGTPSEIYEKPCTPFVADFIGDTNLVQGRVSGHETGILTITSDSGLTLRVQAPEEPLTSSQAVVSTRPEKIQVSSEPVLDSENCLAGTLNNILYLGTHIQYIVDLSTGDRMTVLQPNALKVDAIEYGSKVYVHWSCRDSLALDG